MFVIVKEYVDGSLKVIETHEGKWNDEQLARLDGRHLKGIWYVLQLYEDDFLLFKYDGNPKTILDYTIIYTPDRINKLLDVIALAKLSIEKSTAKTIIQCSECGRELAISKDVNVELAKNAITCDFCDRKYEVRQ
jgi:hypothetical protein